MDHSSSSDAGSNAPVVALASLLGVKGPLRLVPQGSTPKAHIVLKRDYPKGDDDLDDLRPGVARFSFIAGKKFTASKGQVLYFAVASPTDRDGKTLVSDEHSYLIEANIPDATEENDTEEDEEEAFQHRRKRKRAGNIEGLPPRMRKSYAKKKTYTSFIERESASSLGFPGYPLGTPTVPRVFCSASVQTENAQQTTPISLEPIPLPRNATPIPAYVEKSPLQLPSPVSADHPLEPTSDDLSPLEGEDTDAFSRAERSLSPMDLSSTSSSSFCSPALKELSLPVESHVIPVCDTQPTESGPTPPPEATPHPTATLPEPMANSPAPAEPPIPRLPSETPPAEDTPASTPRAMRRMLPTPPASSQGNEPSDVSTAGDPPEVQMRSRSPTPPPAENANSSDVSKVQEQPETTPIVPDQPEHIQELSIKKEIVVEAEKALSVQNIVASTPAPKTTPIMPRAMRATATASATPLMSERVKGKAPVMAPGQDYLPTPISMRISTSSSHAQSASPPPEPKQLAYIPSVSSSNPLGIRPAYALPKAAPKAPRSLLPSTTSAPKKPVLVGANWSAAKSSGGNLHAAASSSSLSSLSSSSSSARSLSASTSLASLTSVPSPVVPSAPAPPKLSNLIPYTSPSPPPPPPPESDPPPPLPPQPATNGGSKWKRISCVDGPKPDGPSKPPPSMPSPTLPAVVSKRPLDAVKDVADDGQAERPAKKARESPPAPSPTTTSSSAASGSSSVKPQAPTSSIAKAPPAKSSSNAQPSSSSSASSLSASSSKPQKISASSSSATLKSVPQPLHHPLPPKPALPQLTGSTYWPSDSSKRGRTPEASSSSAVSSTSEPRRAKAAQTNWPATQPSSHYKLTGDVGVQKIVFNSSGSCFAVACTDRTLRICENRQPPAELARLSHNAPLISVCWMEGDQAVLVLTGEGILGSWTRSGKAWNFAKLQRITDLAFMESDMMPQMVYCKDFIAVVIPSGVRIWRIRKGELRNERDIARTGTTAVQFVHDGRALVGGCKDGIVWYCEVANGKLKVQTFLASQAVTSIEVHPGGQHLLVSQAGGKAVLVPLRHDGTAPGEKTYTNEKLQTLTPNRFPAVFATRGQAILYGTVNGCALVWDRKKGVIVYGLKHPEGDSIQAAAAFDGRPGVEGMMITGTKHGRLFWWPQPVAAAPVSSSSSNNGDESQRRQHRGDS